MTRTIAVIVADKAQTTGLEAAFTNWGSAPDLLGVRGTARVHRG